MSQVTLRPYTAADEDAAIELWRRTWQKHYPHFNFTERVPWWRERWRKELVPVARVVVAEIDEASSLLHQRRPTLRSFPCKRESKVKSTALRI